MSAAVSNPPPHFIVRDAGDWDGALELEPQRVEALVAGALAAAVAELSQVRAGEATIVLADDATQARLNALYRGVAASTNVLAFPFAAPAIASEEDGLSEGAVGELLLGDIVLAFETVREEARGHGVAMADHLRHLIIHGFLHLQGYDHQTDDDAALMEGLERRALARLGSYDPYEARWDGDPADPKAGSPEGGETRTDERTACPAGGTDHG